MVPVSISRGYLLWEVSGIPSVNVGGLTCTRTSMLIVVLVSLYTVCPRSLDPYYIVT